MPARTNEFQRLVALITLAAAPKGAKVTQSAFASEPGDGAEREMDVQVEHEVAGHPIRIAIEARDHERAQTIEWIDALSGKYRDLGMSLVVAVSSAGFTQGALEKAARLNIRALTLDEALKEDWEAALVLVGVKYRIHHQELAGASLQFVKASEPLGRTSGDWIIQGANGEDPETVAATLMRLYWTDAERLTDEYVRDNRLGTWDTQKDVDFEFPIRYEANGRFLVPPSGKPRELICLELRVKGRVQFVDAAIRRFRYDAKLVTIASAEIEGNRLGQMAVVQPAQPTSESIEFGFAFEPNEERHPR